MSKHVDLVKNEWSAGMQIRLVTALDADGGPQLANITPGWEDLLARPLKDVNGTTVYIGKESLDVLPRLFRSEYVFATEVHEESECPFRWGAVLPMKSLNGDLGSSKA
jgi:hypothetical protein